MPQFGARWEFQGKICWRGAVKDARTKCLAGQITPTELKATAKFASFDQLYLLPQCGFASTGEGNLLAEEDPWAKSSRCVEAVREV